MEKPDIDALLALKDSNKAVIKLDDYLGGLCNYGEEIEVLTPPQKNFYLNQQFEREINNGGFEQFFFNSTGDYAHETIRSLTVIGAAHAAKLLTEAINEFPDSTVFKETETRRKIMLELWPDSDNGIWQELDDLFYEYKDDLNTLNLSYVAAHRAKF